MIADTDWLQGEFLTTVQKRGAAIIEARGPRRPPRRPTQPSTRWSACARATAAGDCVSVAVASQGQYGTPEGLQFGFPVRADGKGGWSVAEGVEHDDFATDRIRITTDELLSERSEVEALGLLA